VDDIDMMGTMRRGRESHAAGLSFDEAVERVPFLRLLTPTQRDRLRAVSTVQTTPQGEPVWSMDEPTGAYSFLIAGHVKLLRPREDGRDVILDIRGPGEVLCVGAVSATTPYCCSAVVISEDAASLTIPRRDVDAILEVSPPAAGLFMRQAALHEIRLTGRVVELASGQVDQRLATLLLRLGDQVGVAADAAHVRIPLRLSRQDLADLCGTTLESAIRTMTHFARDGAVTTLPDGFVIENRHALEELARGRK
jgi:CRP/FNR family transcriptional regulator